jgi:hypothetical protein
VTISAVRRRVPEMQDQLAYMFFYHLAGKGVTAERVDGESAQPGDWSKCKYVVLWSESSWDFAPLQDTVDLLCEAYRRGIPIQLRCMGVHRALFRALGESCSIQTCYDKVAGYQFTEKDWRQGCTIRVVADAGH